jgi:hypothetical protein
MVKEVRIREIYGGNGTTEVVNCASMEEALDIVEGLVPEGGYTTTPFNLERDIYDEDGDWMYAIQFVTEEEEGS